MLPFLALPCLALLLCWPRMACLGLAWLRSARLGSTRLDLHAGADENNIIGGDYFYY